MATKKAKKAKATAGEVDPKNLPVVSKQVAPALIREAQADEAEQIERPDFLVNDMIEDESATGFNPLIDFEGEPGRWIVAKYLGMRPDIGPNSSAMYDFEAINPESGQTFVASLWGSTILDKKMEMLLTKGSLKPGKFTFVQYLGSVDTSRGMNPAKNFKIAVIKDGALDKYYDALKKPSQKGGESM